MRELSFLDGVIEDGRPLLQLTAVALLLSGLFALFLSSRREFLPHDIAFLGMSAEQLCSVAGCRVVGFMFHDRVAFGGTLIAVAILYVWLAAFPLRMGYSWSWWAFLLSATLGFLSFLAYLGYGYLDSWHGVATLALLPVYAAGLIRIRPFARTPSVGWLRSPEGRAAPGLARMGRIGLIATGAGMVGAGLVILGVGSTAVFVPQDLAFMQMTREQLELVNHNLIPLIAHDRAGFGGGLASAGLLVIICAWYARSTASFRQAFLISGVAGFGCAIGIHYIEGYTDWTHLAPAIVGAILFTISLTLETLGARKSSRGAALEDV